MANFDLINEHADDWRKKYWKDKLAHKDEVDRVSEEINLASVTTVLKPRNLENESKDFFKAQIDMTKDGLPKETMAKKGTEIDNGRIRLDLFDQQWHRNDDFTKADDKMLPTPLDAYNVVYPSGNAVPTSPNTKPSSSISDRGDDGIPQGKIGSIQLEEKSGASSPIGDNYLPDGAWNGKDKVKPPQIQQSSGWDAMKFTDLDFQDGIGKTNKDKKFNNLGEILQKYIEAKDLKI